LTLLIAFALPAFALLAALFAGLPVCAVLAWCVPAAPAFARREIG
jgi:hypothetical protein